MINYICDNMLKMSLEERIGRIVTVGLFDRITGVAHRPNNVDKYVAAGNPGIVAQKYPTPIDIPDTFIMGGKICYKNDYQYRTVFGNSMLVDGIHSGWELLLNPVKDGCIKQGDFIVISVDKEYFNHRHHTKVPLFQLKLRRAVGSISTDDTKESLCERLIGTFAEPLDENDQEDLGESMQDARSFYNNDELLFLSVTYHKTDIHYSFHPLNSIMYRVEGVAYLSGKGVEFKSIEEL